MIDLRSDTVSKPTEGMRKAIYRAEVGDNCFGDDLDTLRLEEFCADYFGKAKALFTVGGTLSNQIALKSLTQPGDEVVLHSSYHINYFEAASTSAFSGVNFNTIDTDDGVYDSAGLDAIYNAKARWNTNYSLPKLVVIENTVGAKGGTIFPLGNISGISKWAMEKGASLYLDGARILHASASTGVDVKEYTRPFDAMAVCMSKSLGAPIGSVLLGDEDFINTARKFRKWFGGDMHQSGIAASAALYAMKNNILRINEDHENIKHLYDLISDVSGVSVTYRGTNMLYVDVQHLQVSASELTDRLKQDGVLCLAWDSNTLRFMSCLNVSRADIHAAGLIIQRHLSRAHV